MFLCLYLCISLASDIKGIMSEHFNDKELVINASGSSSQGINNSIQPTKPEYSIYPWNKDYDWCSTIEKSYDNKPFIAYTLKKRKFKFNGYFIRTGCCYEDCCCIMDGYGCYDCCLYSWNLQISDDNKTWKDVHRVEKDDTMRRCKEKSFKLDQEYAAKYVRIIQMQPCPGFPPCMAINRFELFGEAIPEDFDFVSYHDDDDDVSIIGHISRNNAI